MPRIFIASLLFVLLQPGLALAHLAAGEDKTVGSYMVDFGYDPSVPVAGGETLFAVNVVDEASKTAVPFTHAWLRISQGEQVVFSGNLVEGLPGNVTVSYTLPRAGEYEVAWQFYQGTTTLVSTAFRIPNVLPDPAANTSLSWPAILAIDAMIVIVLVVGVIIFRRKSAG